MKIEAIIRLGDSVVREFRQTVYLEHEHMNELQQERLIKALTRSIEASLLLQFNLGPYKKEEPRFPQQIQGEWRLSHE